MARIWRIAMLYSKLGENRSDHENPYELVGEYRDKYRYKLVWFENRPHGLFSALLLSSAAVDESIFYQIFICDGDSIVLTLSFSEKKVERCEVPNTIS